jgi:hypothetical protein
MPIPKLFHFVYLGFTEFTYLHFLAVKTCYIVHQPRTIYLYTHFTREKNTTWWDQVQQYITVERVDLPKSIFGNPVRKFQHMADVIRLEKLIERGGVYFDLDVVSLKPLGSLYQERCVLGTQAPLSRYEGLCNAVILAEPRSEFLMKWYQEYRTFQSGRWDFHSVKIPLLLSRLYGNLLRILDSKKFFPVTWKDTDFLYNRSFDHVLKHSYVVHLWDSIWGKDHLANVSPELLTRNSTFSYYVNLALTPKLSHTTTKQPTFIPKRIPFNIIGKPSKPRNQGKQDLPKIKPTKISDICQSVFQYQQPINDIVTQTSPITPDPLEQLKVYLEKIPEPINHQDKPNHRSILSHIGSYHRFFYLGGNNSLTKKVPTITNISPDLYYNSNCVKGYVGRVKLSVAGHQQEVWVGDRHSLGELFGVIGINPSSCLRRLSEKVNLITVSCQQFTSYFLEGFWVLPTILIVYLWHQRRLLTLNLAEIQQMPLNLFINKTNPSINSIAGLVNTLPIYHKIDGISIYKILQTNFPKIQFMLIDIYNDNPVKIAYRFPDEFNDDLSKLNIVSTCQLFRIESLNHPYICKIINHRNGNDTLIPTKWILPFQSSNIPELAYQIYQPPLRTIKYLRNTVESTLI